jgi:hypothetical protein
VPQHRTDPVDDAGIRGGRHGSGAVVQIESDTEAAKRLAAKLEDLVLKAGSGGLKRETASGEAALDAQTPARQAPWAPDVNPVVQAAVEVVMAANGAADAAASLASKAADSAAAATNAVAHAGNRPAGEAMSTANRAAEQNAYDAHKAADAAANIADRAGEQAHKAEFVASLLQNVHE